MGKQFHLYTQCEQSKVVSMYSLTSRQAFLQRCLGGVLTKVVDAQFVISHVELMFKAAEHSSSDRCP